MCPAESYRVSRLAHSGILPEHVRVDSEIQKRPPLPRARFDWRIGAWRANGPVPAGWPRFIAVKQSDPAPAPFRLIAIPR